MKRLYFKILTITAFANCLTAALPLRAEDLAEVQHLSLPELRGASSLTMSDDGKFLYAAAFSIGTVSEFSRDTSSGELTLGNRYDGPALKAAVRIRLSKDGKSAVSAAFAANTISVFDRDAENGALVNPIEISGKPGLGFVIDANFSPDGKMICTAASTGVGVFTYKDGNNGKEVAPSQFEEADGSLKGVRNCVFSPDGKWLYAPAYVSGALGVFRCDSSAGKLEWLQSLTNDDPGISGLKGAFRVAASDDGRNVYVSAGRFGGDQGISVFEVQADGKLKMLQGLVNGTDDLGEFEGGNEIRVSPDGKSVFAVATLSDRLFHFSREPESGKLKFVGSQQVGNFVQPGADALCFSPDGKFIYVTSEKGGSIDVYRLN